MQVVLLLVFKNYFLFYLKAQAPRQEKVLPQEIRVVTGLLKLFSIPLLHLKNTSS